MAPPVLRLHFTRDQAVGFEFVNQADDTVGQGAQSDCQLFLSYARTLAKEPEDARVAIADVGLSCSVRGTCWLQDELAKMKPKDGDEGK